MSYSVLNPIDETKITRLGFEAEPCNYIYENSNGIQKSGTVYKVENSIYENIINILEGNEAHSISKGDKVFILPGHPLTAARIKTYLKKIGANVTKNVNIATIIAGTYDFHVKLKSNEQAKFLNMMMHWKDGYTVEINDEEELDSTYHHLYSVDLTERQSYISPLIGNYIGDINIQMAGEELTFLTPLALDVLYNVLSRNLKVVTADTISDDANSELKLLEKETFISISSMLNSTDISNRKMGLSLLFHCDLRGEIRYAIWKLANKFDGIIKYSDKSKSRDHFMDRTEWNKFARISKENFLEMAIEDGYLTQNILDELIPEIKEEQFNYIINSVVDERFYKCHIIDNGDIVISLENKWKNIKIKKEEDESVQLQESSNNQ